MRGSGDNRATDTTLASEPASAAPRVAGGLPAGWEARRRTRDAMRDPSTLLWLISLAIAGAYAIVFVARFPHNISEITWNADYSAYFVLFETFGRTGPAGHTIISSSGQWVTLWFGMLTARLPLHRELWSAAPTLSLVAAALLVGWSVAQISIRRAAILAVLIVVVASPPAWSFFMAMGAHGTAYLCTALLGAYLVYLTRGPGRLMTFLLPPAAGIVAGVCLASDLLLASAAVIPLGVTALVASLTRDRRSRVVGLSAFVTVGVAIPIAKLTTATMNSLGFLTLPTPEKLAPSAELGERAELLFKGLETLFNGALSPTSPDPVHSTVGIVSDVVMTAALTALVLSGVLALARLIRSSYLKPSSLTPTQLARTLHVIYWVTSAGTACGAFWLAAETGGGTDLHSSYYATVIFSVAAVIPLLLSSGPTARWLIPAGAAIFFASGLVRINGTFLDFGGTPASTAPGIERAAVASHVSYGYAGYGEAPSLTWHTSGRLTVRPLLECQNPAGVGLCPFYMSAIPSWYVPRQRRSFLLVNSQEAWVSRLPSGLGKPTATYTFGPIFMYVYPYDIASRLGPQPD
jgi:hypothetical protein